MKFETNRTYTTSLQYDNNIKFEMNIINLNKKMAKIIVEPLGKIELPCEIYTRKIINFEGKEFINVSDGIVFCADRYAEAC